MSDDEAFSFEDFDSAEDVFEGGDDPEESDSAEEGEVHAESEIVMENDMTNSTYVIVVKPEDRMGSDMMSVYELTSFISTRAEMIDKYGIAFVDITPDMHRAVDVAKAELEQKKCPLKTKRFAGWVNATIEGKTGLYKSYEYWHANELGIPDEINNLYPLQAD